MRLRRPNPRTLENPDHEESREREVYGPEGRTRAEHVNEYEDRRPSTVHSRVYADDSPAPSYPPIGQIVALIVGVFFLVIGAIALARAGFEDMTAETTVAGLPHTGVLGAIEIGFGVLLLMGAASGAAGRGLMAFLGALMLAWGIVVVMQPSILHDVLGMEAVNGWVYLTAGLVTVLAGFLIPTYLRRRRSYVYDDTAY